MFYAVYNSHSVFCSSMSSDICLKLTQVCGNSTDSNSATLYNHDLLLIRPRRWAKNQDNNMKICMKMLCIYMHIFGLLVFTKPFSERPNLGKIMLNIGRKKSSTLIKKHSELHVTYNNISLYLSPWHVYSIRSQTAGIKSPMAYSLLNLAWTPPPPPHPNFT